MPARRRSRPDPLIAEVSRLAAGVSTLTDVHRVYRVTRYLLEEGQRMVETRLGDKLRRAAGVVGRLSKSLEEKADGIIAREGELERKAEAAFAPHHAQLDAAHAGLDELENQIKQISNSDPSQGSGEKGRPL